MKGGKGNNWNQAYLAGIQAQTSVYNAAIPVYYGRTRGNPLLIWANNLRQGSTGKKAKKSGVTVYNENVDFLLAHNPIAGVLQVWYNTSILVLGFDSVSGTLTGDGDGGGSYTIADSDYYFLLGVTADVNYSQTFNDYGGQGPVTESGTYELPLWNVNYAGPDPTNQSGYRNWPAIFQWIPYSGATVRFPAGSAAAIPGATGTFNFYYAKLVPDKFALEGKVKKGTYVPLTALRLAFEPVLGSGGEYGSKYAAQQIKYPPYAGMGSSDFDMGAAGASPPVLPEVMGMFPLYPSGDADFADMIEDIFKSGPAQAGTGAAVAYGDIHHGLGCCDFPGTVQKKVGVGASSLTYDLPNTAGNFLWVLAYGGSGDLGISDTAANSWTSLMTAGTTQLWRAVAKPFQSNVVTIANANGSTQITMLETAGLDTLDGSAVVTTGTGGTCTAAIPTTNLPGENSLILSFVVAAGAIPAPPYHWENETVQANTQADQRAQFFPNTYQVSYAFGSGVAWTSVLVALKNSQPNSFALPLGNILDPVTLNQSRLQCRAYGLIGSLFMGSQKKATDWLEELYAVSDTAPVWSGDVLKSIPLAEQSYAGNGAIYISPTAAGPVANLISSDFVADKDNPPVEVDRNAQVDAPDLQQLQYPNRDSNYDQSLAAEPDNGATTLYGPTFADAKTYSSIQTSAVATLLLGIMIREANINRNTYIFKLQPKWCLLEAGDLITIPLQATMPGIQGQLLSTTIPVRLTSVTINDDFTVSCEAEPFIYGLRSPIAGSVTTPTPYAPGLGADPGDVNPPVFIEAVPRLAGSPTNPVLLVALSGASIAYGGCIAYLSTDGGMSYNPIGANGGLINGSAAMGVTVGDWPANADPDMTHDLSVNLTMSLGSLSSFQVSDEDSFLYPCYVAGGGSSNIPYELMTYAVADLTSTYNYTLKATGGGGNHLRRAVFGAPAVGEGVDHPNASAFVFMSPNNPTQPGILQVPLTPTLIGATLYFKFTAFNTTGGGLQALSDVTAYTFTPTGLPGGGIAQNQQYTQVPAVALTQPSGTAVDMAQIAVTFQTNTVNYNARTFTIANPSVPTTYYVTIADPSYVGDTGAATTLTAYCETTTEKVGIPGYTYVGLIIAVPGGGAGATAGPGGWPVPQSAIVTP